VRATAAALRAAALLAAALPAAALLAAAPAHAAVRLGPEPGLLHALAAGPGSAYAVVGSGDRREPFRLVRSAGRGASVLGTFGGRGAAFADVAADSAGAVVTWGRPTSDGFAYETSLVAGGVFTEPATLGEGTGPAVLGLERGARVAVFPDDEGNAAIAVKRAGAAPAVSALTSTGPQRRHAPLDAVVARDGAVILDRVQARGRTELRVLGPGAPADPVTSVPRVQDVDATLARDRERVYVAYRSGDRAVLASAPPRADATWRRRTLPGRHVRGVPAVARVGLRTLVATSRRGDIVLTTIGPAGAFTERLTRSRARDLAPLAATAADDRAYVGWTRRVPGRRRAFALIERVV
jgi:hypothetical protein